MRTTLIAAIVLLLVNTSTAAASGVIDQQQTSTNTSYGCPLGYDGGRHAQGVSPGSSSWSEVSLFVGPVRDVGDPLTVNIREPATDASPTGTILGSATAAVPDSVGTPVWLDFVFTTPVSLTPGSLVFIELELGDSVTWWASDLDPYAGGEAWAHCGGGDFGEFPLVRLPGSDFAFITRTPADDDGDGIPDEADPDTVATIVAGLDPAVFNAPGNQTALLSRLDNAEALIQAWYDTGDTAARDQAIADLQNLLRRLDGCGTSPDSNDWISDCTAQLEVREAIQDNIDALLAA